MRGPTAHTGHCNGLLCTIVRPPAGAIPIFAEAIVIARRKVLIGGLSTFAGSAMGCGCALASGHTGCVIADRDASRFLARDDFRHNPTRQDRIIKTSDDRDFDYALAQTLSGLTDTFGVLPGFAYYDDRAIENAYATPARRLGNPDGTVLLGRRFLRSLLARGADADVAVAAICAHEFAHIVQFKYRLLNPLLKGARTVKRVELHADFLAGYYAGIRKLQKPDYPAAAFAAGLSNLKPSTPAVLQHGNADERARAIAFGFKTSYRDRRNMAEAAQIGLDYIRLQKD